MQGRRSNPGILRRDRLRSADEPYLAPFLAYGVARRGNHIVSDPRFQAFDPSCAPPRAKRPLKQFRHSHKRDRQHFSLEMRAISFRQRMAFEQEGKDIRVEEQIAHRLASSRPSRRRE